MTDHHKNQLLDALMYHLSQEMRGIIAREVPAAYNDYCQSSRHGSDGPVVKVVRTSDGSEW